MTQKQLRRLVDLLYMFETECYNDASARDFDVMQRMQSLVLRKMESNEVEDLTED